MCDNVEVFSEDSCVICGQNFDDYNSDERVTLRAKGLATLIRYCSLRSNERLQQYLESGPDFVNDHVKCWIEYTKECGIFYAVRDATANDANPAKKTKIPG